MIIKNRFILAFTILLTSLLIVGMPSCEPCPGPTGDYFDIKGINLKNYRQESPTIARMVNNNEEVNFKDFFFLVEFSINFISGQHSTGGMLHTAYAVCDDAGTKGSREYMTDMVFITNYDYDASHQASDTINDLINFPVIFPNDTTAVADRVFTMTLKSKPTINQAQSFTVHYYQTNGEYYTSTTPLIRFK